LIAHTDYLIKIKNTTDAKHELIIGSNGTEIAKRNKINPGKNKIFVFNSNTTEIFEYHCEYHPDTMKGIIEPINNNPENHSGSENATIVTMRSISKGSITLLAL
jgi:hypothetical protein